MRADRLSGLTIRIAWFASLAGTVAAQAERSQAIPLPEHPRPDFERDDWLNLNGTWRFAYDRDNTGERAGWIRGDLPGAHRILVPFSWGAPLSGVSDSADIRWGAPPHPDPPRAPGPPRLPGVRRLRLAHHGVARRRPPGRAPGRLHPVLLRADRRGASGSAAAPRGPGGRPPPPVQARGEAGLRPGARHVADGVPRGARLGAA